MSVKQQNVTERSLVGLTWPIFVDILFVFLISVVDAWFLSRVSDAAAAAVGAILPVSRLGFTLFVSLSVAGISVASQRIGAGDTARLKGTYGALMVLGLIAGLAITVIMATFAPQFSHWMGLRGEMAEMAALYLHTLALGAGLLSVRYAASAILSSQGKTHLNMWATALMTLANLGLNYALVYGKFGLPAMGIQGVALASCLAWAVSLAFTLYAVVFLVKTPVELPFRWADFKTLSAPILKLGSASVVEPLSWHFSQLVIIAMVVQLGELALATRVYAFNILFIVALFGTALSAGVQIKVAHYIGALRFDDAHRELLQGLKFGLLTAVASVAAIFLLSDQLFGLFTRNPAILALGAMVVAVALFCEIGRVLNLVVGASLKASGDARYISIMGISIMWALAVPLSWLLGIHLAYGLVGIWVAMSIDELVRGVIALKRWNSRKWEAKGLYAERRPAIEEQAKEAELLEP